MESLEGFVVRLAEIDYQRTVQALRAIVQIVV